MTNTIKAIWNTLIAEVKKAQKNDNAIYFDEANCSYSTFEKYFRDEYNSIKKIYMTQNTEFLDRHKVAAIIIKTVIDLKLIKYKKEIAENQVFIGIEIIAINVALSYMFEMLIRKMKTVGLSLPVKSYILPIPMSCDTDYIYIFARNLKYCQNSGGIIAIELSDKLFLFESLTLKEFNIDPHLLKDTI